jgi:hypothetical protein
MRLGRRRGARGARRGERERALQPRGGRRAPARIPAAGAAPCALDLHFAEVYDPLCGRRGAVAPACMLSIIACRRAPSAKQWVTPGSARRRRRRSGRARAPARTRPRPPSSKPRCGAASPRRARARLESAGRLRRAMAALVHLCAWCTCTDHAVRQQGCCDALSRQALGSCMCCARRCCPSDASAHGPACRRRRC